MIGSTVQARSSAAIAALLVSLFCSDAVWAQADQGDDAAPALAPTGQLINKVDLPVRLIDDDGNLAYLPGRSLEDVTRALTAKTGEAAADIMINGSIDLQGAVDKQNRYCVIDILYDFRLTDTEEAEDEQWIAVPLRLDDAVVDPKSVMLPDEGDLYRDESGYVAWLRTKPGTNHSIKLQAKVALAKVGGVTTLSVKLPNMTTNARIVVPRTGVAIERPDERSSLLDKEEDAQNTTILVENAGGGIEVGWLDRPIIRPVLEVDGAIRVNVHANDVSAEADLTVKSRGGPIDSFVVYLPPGMELTSRDVPGFRPMTTEQQQNRQAVTVQRIAGKTSNVIEIQLAAAMPKLASGSAKRSLELGGFVVKDADRQLGVVDVTVAGNWSVAWKHDDSVQLEPRPRQSDTAAPPTHFVYDTQPFSLTLDLVRKQPRLRVAADYIVRVSDSQAHLEAKLNYESTGAQAEHIRLSIADWLVDEIEVGDVQVDEILIDDQSNLTVPIELADTSSSITIRAHQTLPSEDGIVQIQVPRLLDLPQPPETNVVVVPSANVELTPQLADIKWLVETTRPEMMDTITFEGALFYREESSADLAEASLFVARKRARSRTVDVVVASDASLETGKVVLDQSLALTIEYGTLRELIVALPNSIADAEELKFLIDGEQAPHEIQPETGEADPARPKLVRVDLLRDRVGEVVLNVACELPRAEATSGELTRIPLIQPMEDDSVKVSRNLLTVSADSSIALESADDSWSADNAADASATDANRLSLQATGLTSECRLQTSLAKQQPTRAMRVSRAWLQTVVSNAERFDRAVFRLLSDQPQIQLQLPEYADRGDVRAAIGGESVKASVDEAGIVRVTQPPELLGRDMTLDVWYGSTLPATTARDVPAVLPLLEGTGRIEHVYWELVLPRQQHLAWYPRLLTPEMEWQLHNLYWGPRSRMDQRELEGNLQASALYVPPDTNRYLFSSGGGVASVTFQRVSRLSLMLIFSGLALVVVVPFFYLPSLRHPAIYFAIGMVLVALAVTFPEPAVLCGQAGAIGVALALLACLLNRAVGPETTPAPPTQGSVYVTFDSQASNSVPILTEGSSRATTATAPAHLQVSQPEDEP